MSFSFQVGIGLNFGIALICPLSAFLYVLLVIKEPVQRNQKKKEEAGRQDEEEEEDKRRRRKEGKNKIVHGLRR